MALFPAMMASHGADESGSRLVGDPKSSTRSRAPSVHSRGRDQWPLNTQPPPKSPFNTAVTRQFQGYDMGGSIMFHKWRYPQMDPNGRFTRENPSKMDDLGVALF